jgi:hypothetical protein
MECTQELPLDKKRNFTYIVNHHLFNRFSTAIAIIVAVTVAAMSDKPSTTIAFHPQSSGTADGIGNLE